MSLSPLQSRNLKAVFAAMSLAVACLVSPAVFAADEITPPAQPPEAEARNVQTVHFFSKALNQDRAFNLILPLDYETSTSRYPVLYLLHGYGGNNTDWTEQTNLSEYAARYRLIIVMPNGSNGWYVNNASDPKQRFEDQIIKDLIPYVEDHYRTIPLRRARAIAGLSMGGYGAMFLGLKHYEMFTAIASFSGALGVAHGLLNPPANATEQERKNIADIHSHFGPDGSASAQERDPFELVKKVPPAEMPMLYFAEGGEDFLIDSNHQFVALLAKLRIPYEYREVSPREHTWDFWDEQIRVFLEKLARLQGFESRDTEARGK
ncbi:MAG TPA: alpha/beta hydrolase family protein [Terriglobia bacterium]|nr:alpha/beta hydrolase family protein [Terriglobia bacterium]